MRNFALYYRWGMEMKGSMGLYFSGLVFMKFFADWAGGRRAMDALILMEMLLVSMVFASAESRLFPRHRKQENLPRNTVLWALLAHLCFGGGAALLHWFSPTPWWMALILVLTFELSLAAMWYGYHVALKMDTHRLNRGLKQFQQAEEP